MYHETIQKLLHMTDNIEFERMMCDLLASLEYKGIDPQSPGLQDGGKDAIYYNGSEKVWFAFSLRKDWKRKFNEDYEKAQEKGKEFCKFVFCSNQAIPVLERDKIIKEKKKDGIEVDFFDQERIRVALDTDFKKIRQIYLGIQDNTTIRRKIRNILFDPQNEVKRPESWKLLSMIAFPEMIGLFNEIKDQDLTIICETQEEHDLFKEFMNAFLIVRKVSTDIDNRMFSVVGDNVPDTTRAYWKMISEYCKLRLVGIDKNQAEKRISLWNIRSFGNPRGHLADCERILEVFQNDVILQEMLQKFSLSYKKSIGILSKIKELKAFKI